MRIEAPCLDCGESMVVEMKDGELTTVEPDTILAYTSVPFREWFTNLPYS